MDLKTYSISTDVNGGEVNVGLLSQEIKDSGHVTGFEGLRKNGDSLVVIGASIADEPSLDSLVANHEPKTLTELKSEKYLEIDGNTVALIAAGFQFDGESFSLSAGAQLNWSEIHTNKLLLTFPLEISTLDNNTYDLELLDVEDFWSAALNGVKTHLDSGRALKKQVFDAADKAAVLAVVDNR